jgi:uncharacterized protein YggE
MGAMKGFPLLVAAWLFVCATASAADSDLPHVTVFGTATTEVVPDQMIWSVTAKNKAPLLQDAAEEHTSTVQQVLTLLKDRKVPETKTQTAQMVFGENQEYRNGSWMKEGYFASTDISFTLEDLGQYGPLWMGLSRIPNVSVRAVRYEHSKRIEYQNETRKKAVAAARDKARMLAEALGSTIAELLLIEEDLSATEGWGRGATVYNVRTMEEGAGISEEPLAPGRIPITSRVKVAFRLVSHDH